MMKFLKYIFFLFLLYSTANAQHKKVLVEVFTNSHCPLCPPAHNALSSYMQTGQYSGNVTYIFYHMVFPYPDDKLNNANPDDSNARNLFYGPYYSTPVGFFDGKVQSSSYSSWAGSIDAEAITASPFELTLEGSADLSLAKVTAKIKETGIQASGDLVVNFVAVENVIYDGRNGISDHKYVMRKMFPTPDGKPLSISPGESIGVEQSMLINKDWNTGKLGFVVFIQDRKTREVFQSEYISFNSIFVTGVDETENTPSSYNLFQNYPNPFNPSTTIKFSIPFVETLYSSSLQQNVSLIVYDMLGKKVATLVNEQKQPGDYEVKFDGSKLSSGIYFYTLKTTNFTQTKKLILIR